MSNTILLVDDDRAHRRLFKRLLERSGIDIQIVEGGSTAEGRELIDRHLNELKLAVFDLNLGDGRGSELAKRVKDSQGTFPIVVLSTSGLEFDRDEALAAGATEFITKSPDVEELLRSFLPLLRSIGLCR